MEDSDANLVEKIIEKGDYLLLRVMDACLFLEIEWIRKRIACGVALKLMRSTVEELNEVYEIQPTPVDEESIRAEFRPIVEDLKKNSMD